MKSQQEKNRENAVSFYRTAFEGNASEAIEKYAGDTYIQHNPSVPGGKEGFIRYFTQMAKEYPEKSIEFLRSAADGYLVALHTRQIWPGNEEYVTMDFFRFDENGKIVEHWDAIQKVPESTENGNTMY